MKKKTVKFKQFTVHIQSEQPKGDDGKSSYGLTSNWGNDITLYMDTNILNLAHETAHAITLQQHYDELMSLCGYDEKICNMLMEKIATITENTVGIIFLDEQKKTKQVFEKMEQLAKELSIPKKSASEKLLNSHDQNKNDCKKVGDELSKITQPIEQNHTKEEIK